MRDDLDKKALVSALRDRIGSKLEKLTASQNTSQAGAAHEEARSEHPKDTRATEASYLARGLADRVGQLQSALVQLAQFAPPPLAPDAEVALGALVEIEDEDGSVTTHFLVPAGGGEKIESDGTTVHTLSPTSPLGQGIVGREVDDEFELDLPRGRTTLTIVAVG